MSDGIKYNKSTIWMKPFVEAVAHLVPINKLEAIKGYRIVKDKEAGQAGALIKYSDPTRYVLTLQTQHWNNPSRNYKNLFIGSMLEVLAHELSHLRVWTHSQEHWMLQSEIQLVFGRVLKELEIDDTSARFK